jgi:Zn-dependent peptidase ImmA (M78 family)
MAMIPDFYKDIENLANGKLGELRRTSRVLKEEVFKLLADQSYFIQYPIEDDEFCAMVCFRKEHLFSVINSWIPYDKQCFAAAHELYHVWFDRDLLYTGEVLRQDVLDDSNGSEQLDVREKKANLFAALLLVPTQILQLELDFLGVDKGTLTLAHIIRLMDTFCVPYKTMLRRLHEIGFLSTSTFDTLLEIPDRDEYSGVLLEQKKLRLGMHLQKRTKEYRFASMVSDAVSAFEGGKISYDRLKDLLSYSRLLPQDVISLPLEDLEPSHEDVLAVLEHEDME